MAAAPTQQTTTTEDALPPPAAALTPRTNTNAPTTSSSTPSKASATPSKKASKASEPPQKRQLAQLQELVDASLKFTRVLKKKGVSQATLSVFTRIRPLTKGERASGGRSITRTVDDQCVVVLDPTDDSKFIPEVDEEGVVHRRRKAPDGPAQGVKQIEKRFMFDRAFDGTSNNVQIYEATVAPLVHGVLRGLNATVFAYGATGSGKTYTMVGSDSDPGLMLLSMRDIFQSIAKESEGSNNYDVTCSYCEVYNEQLYDLLSPSVDPLELREDPEKGPIVSDLRHVRVQSEDRLFALLREGNLRRKTESTDANAVSSRSHAVLEIIVRRSDRNHYVKQVYEAKLALVDLAGAERARETNNVGSQLRDGANINRSLLALANCINALGKRRKKGFVFVPFRNSKLTRLLKDGLCGNSRTAMIATVAPTDKQYAHTVNTLKYADRAKEIKTHVRRNASTVEAHIAEYQRMIDALQEENSDLRAEIALLRNGEAPPPKVVAPAPAPAAPAPAPAPMPEKPTGPPAKVLLGAVEALEKNTREQMRHQRAMLEAEEQTVRLRYELEQVEAQLVDASGSTGTLGEKVLKRRQMIAGALGEREAEKRNALKSGLAAMEERRAIVTSLGPASKPADGGVVGAEAVRAVHRAGVVAMDRAEDRALIAVRDSIIEEQQAVIHCLWRVLEWGGIGRARAFQIAAEHGLPGPLPGVTNEDPASAGARLEQQLTGARAAQRYKWWKARPRGGADASKEAGGGGGGGGPSSHSPRE